MNGNELLLFFKKKISNEFICDISKYFFNMCFSTGLDLLHSVGIAHLSLRIVLVTGISRYRILKLQIFDNQLVD